MTDPIKQAIINIQEEIKRDLAKEKEIKERREVGINENEVDKTEEVERGRSITKKSSQKYRSKSSDKRKVYFGENEDDPPSPNYTIYKEGGQGYTKYTVYTKNKVEEGTLGKVEKIKTEMERPSPLANNKSSEAMKRHLSLPRERRKPSMEQFINKYKEKPTGNQPFNDNNTFVGSTKNRKVTGKRTLDRPEDLINAEMLLMHQRELEHRRMMGNLNQK